MATVTKSKAASAKSPKKTVTKAPAKAQPKTAAAKKPLPKKATRTPVQTVKKSAASKPVSAAKAKAVKKATPPPKPVKKGAVPVVAPSKDLKKKPVKPAFTPVSKTVSKPAPHAEPKKARLNKSDLDHFKGELLAMRDRITGQSGSMRHAALQRNDEINPEEDGTDAFMRLQTLEQVSSQQQIISNIDEALRAIEKGTYGVCDACGELINKPRLSVLPFAKNCITCQSEMERVVRPGGRR